MQQIALDSSPLAVSRIQFGHLSELSGWTDAFIEGQAHALASFGVSIAQHRPCDAADVYLTLAIDADNQLIGGTRLHLAGSHVDLPLETIVGRVVNAPRRHVTAELAGVWIHPRYRKQGLSHQLLCTTLACTQLLGLQHVLLLGHTAVLPLYAKHGWRVDTNVPAARYPDKRYLSAVMRRVIDCPTPLVANANGPVRSITMMFNSPRGRKAC